MCSCLEKTCCSCEMNSWVGELLKNEKIKTYNVTVTGTSEKGDGYIGDITFVEVSAQKEVTYNLVIKHGKTSEYLRETAPVRIAFEREIFIYGKVKPAFEKFLKGTSQRLDFMPRCFGTLLQENQEVLALENLKKMGFDLHNKMEPLDMRHIHLTLDAYARWHAISLAYHDHHPLEFRSLTSNLSDVWVAFAKAPATRNLLENIESNFLKVLEGHKLTDVMEKFRKKYPDFFQSWIKLATEDVEQQREVVITHGDCWNNNFMFKYEPEDTEKQNPTKVVMLDFQLSRLASPVFDLSYHLYAVASAKDLANLKGLLHIYYASLADNIRKLGSDPDKLFPYESLIKHWKKYHLVGLLIAGLVLPVTLVDKEDTMNIEDMNKHSIDDIMTRMVSKTKENLDKRIIDLVRHAVTYEL